MRNTSLKFHLGLFLIFISFFSCKKDNPNTTQSSEITIHNILGTVYADCNYDPAINQQIGVTIYTNGPKFPIPVFGTIINTDSSGKFSIPINQTYSTEEFNGISLTVIEKDSGISSEIDSWPPDVDQAIVLHDTIHLKMNMIVNNPHTISDTLFYFVGTYRGYIIGPFHTTVYLLNAAVASYSYLDPPQWGAAQSYLLWAIGYNNIPDDIGDGLPFKHNTCSPLDSATIVVN